MILDESLRLYPLQTLLPLTEQDLFNLVNIKDTVRVIRIEDLFYFMVGKGEKAHPHMFREHLNLEIPMGVSAEDFLKQVHLFLYPDPTLDYADPVSSVDAFFIEGVYCEELLNIKQSNFFGPVLAPEANARSVGLLNAMYQSALSSFDPSI